MKRTATLMLLMTMALSACQIFNPTQPTATPIPPTPTPLPPKELIVCLGREPESLYPYAAVSLAATDVTRAIFDGPVDYRDGQPVPVILEDIPSMANGNAYVSAVGVSAGDEVINTAGDLVGLQAGVQVFPAGCASAACMLVWDGASPLQMDQLTANFRLKDGLAWSDGQRLTAADSVFSFKIAADPATPINKKAIDQTAAYTATDDLTVQYVSKPGLAVSDLAAYFRLPLPEHAWGGLSASDLLASDEANRNPLGWGPYMLESWTAGESLRLARNPAYFRAGEGLPYFDFINYRFITPPGAGAVAADFQGCDIVSASTLDIAALGALQGSLEGSGYQLVTRTSDSLEMLAFGITPASYADNYYPYAGGDRPDIFGDKRTRKAIAACIDRQAINADLVFSLAEPSDTWLGAENSLLAGISLTRYPYDPAAAATLLAEAGWLDLDLNPATPLAHGGDVRIPFGTPLQITLLSSSVPLQAAIAGQIAADLEACGIGVSVAELPAAELYQPAPDGLIFGRDFDLALLPWETDSAFDCTFFQTAEIPGDGNDWLGTLTGGANFYGYSNPAYDAECARLRSAGLDTAQASQTTGALLQMLADDLPFIPLFHFPEGYLIRESLCVPEGGESEAGLFNGIEAVNDSGGC